MKTKEINTIAYQITSKVIISAYNNNEASFAIYTIGSHVSNFSYPEMIRTFGIPEEELDEIAYNLSHQ